MARFRQILETPLPMAWIVLGGFIAAFFLWGWYSSGLVIRLPRYPLHVLPAAFGLPYDAVKFSSADGVPLEGWFVPSPSASDATVIVCHGYGANRSDVLPATHFLNGRGGHNLFYFDFRNHGESGGRATSLGPLEARDLEAAVDYLRGHKPERSRRIGVYGLSMGGAVAVQVAARRPEIAAVAAESAFASRRDVVARFARLFFHVPRYPFLPVTDLFVRWRLGMDPEPSSPIRHVDKISPRPVLFIQGDSDPRMPVSEGEALYARAKEPKSLWTVPGADHAQAAEIAGEEYQRRLLAFFAGALK